jgi:hypothetical protein
LPIDDCRLTIAPAENRNSKIETRLQRGVAASFASFERQHAKIDNQGRWLSIVDCRFPIDREDICCSAFSIDNRKWAIPDALVARTNLARAKAGRSFDARYATRLSGDAVPELVAALADLNPQDRCSVASGIVKRWALPQPSDWRVWSWSRAMARRVVRENEASLKTVPCPAPN